jgi:sporulation protein YlmC with PRC-barrel domain
MTDTRTRTLVKLGDTGLTVSDPAEDVRGHDVFDRNGEKIGQVKSLMLDEAESKVRFLEVGGGGFLGIGDTTYMIPVDAITRIHDNHVHIDQTREHVTSGPAYDPNLVSERHYTDIYGHYGYSPFWTAGYAYPAYPGYVI